ncbi:MAG: cation-translocating P-type ATPase [Defluviitaleaceae bacterium]|nr:cation-translocating P-type ATPase [Defluviitaleaceae bacterium]MCL2261789.1 cation-translocating P-type ATPase [Defluviitaleaceae bacterium]
MLWVKDNIEDVIIKLNTDKTMGLSPSDVDVRLVEYGLNEFEEEKKETLFNKVLHHLSEIPTLILIAAAAIAGYMAIFHPPDTIGNGWPKVIVILSIVVINVCLGIYQESKAEKALEALKKMNAFKTTVIRDGAKQIIEANQLVPGDVIELSAGDVITADARLIEASSLQVEEAALTGESQPVEKDPAAVIEDTVPLGDRINMVYSGCLVTGGRATAVVVETAMNTEMGKIAALLNTAQKLKTPLQLRLQQLAKRISGLALVAGLLMFAFGFFLHAIDPISGQEREFVDILILAVALGVAAVPETLPIIVTMVLSYGVYNMVEKKTIIRKIPAVETVGNTSVICSDKTGTLTQNKMKIRRIWHIDHDPISSKVEFNDNQKKLIGLLASCSNATIGVDNDDHETVIGDPTEIAIIRMLHQLGMDRVKAERQYPRVFELPFDSGRKRMTTVHHTEDGFIAVTKGAFDRIPVNWEPELLKKATEIHDTFAEKALRVIAISVKKFDKMPEDLSIEALECDQEFRGMVGMIDPPRTESAKAVALAKKAGIKTVMITGDHVVTASAIAKEIGIMGEGDMACTGSQLAKMSDEELHNQVRDISVYARVSPEDKIRIVQAWTAQGEVVAMTGDGVNDAPALKAADVGVAMGITGTEVSKSAADMVITDDNFATIVDAISVGRTAYDNIRKTIAFLLSVNFAEIFILLAGMLFVGVSPLLALQILLINVVSDGIPGFFIAFEKPEHGVMKRKPLSKNSGIFSAGLGMKIARGAVSFSVLTLTAFILGAYVLDAPAHVQAAEASQWGERFGVTAYYTVGISMAFVVLSWASVINIFNIRSEQSIFKVNPLSNKGMFFAAMGTILFTLVVALVPPIAQIFDVETGLKGLHWFAMILLASMQLVFGEIYKLFANYTLVPKAD